MSTLKRKVLGALGGRFVPQAKVEKVENISARFRLIDLSCEKFREAEMLPAAKIRFNAGDWNMRTYTPLTLDASAGRLQILAFLHGEGAGSLWARSVVPGDLVHVLGPSMSLDLMGLVQPAVFFGDETSFAAAKTLPRSATRFVFEISPVAEAQEVVDRLELRNVRLFERQPDDAHLVDMARAIQDALTEITASHLILTGNGKSIQAVRARLRRSELDCRVKAYWAPGKIGLE